MKDKSFWLSWHTPSMYFELHWPWWVSGEDSESRQTICAAIRAAHEPMAWNMVRSSYDLPAIADLIEPRFCSERDADWSPFSDRFQQASWMGWPDCRCPSCMSAPRPDGGREE